MPFHIDTDGTRRRYSFQVQQGFGGNSGGGDGGNNTGSSVVSMPVVTGPTVTGIDSTVTLTATATSLLAGGSVSSFVWTKPNGTTEVKAAVSGSSSTSFTASGADGDVLITKVYARDNAGNKSQVTSHAVTLSLIVVPDVTNMTTNIPSTIAAGESVSQLSITGAMDPDGGSVTYGLTLPAGVTASKTTGLTNGELFSITAAANVTVNPTVNVTITVTASGGGTTQVVRRLAVVATHPTTTEMSWTTPGSYTWTVPENVYSVCALTVDASGGDVSFGDLAVVESGFQATQRQLPATAGWSSVTYGNGLFVAVAYPNIAATSPDGITWTQRWLPTSTNWTSVTYGNGQFVAVAGGSSNVAATSPDGINWTQRTLPNSTNWHSVTYGNGLFVAVAYNSSAAAISPDGINWTQRQLPYITNWVSVTYGNGQFVAVVPGSNAAVTSPDGITWTQWTLPATAQWSSVTYGNGQFVAVTHNNNIAATSPDGITWTQRTLPATANWYSVTYGNGLFVAVAYNSSIAATSPDGITWTKRWLPTSTNWTSVTYGNGQFVAVANGSNIATTLTAGPTATHADATLTSSNGFSLTAPTSAGSYGISSGVAAYNNDMPLTPGAQIAVTVPAPDGAVRVIWGAGRSFPSNAAGAGGAGAGAGTQIGIVLVAESSVAGQWQRVDGNFNPVNYPFGGVFFNRHPIYSGVVPQTIDGQAMMQVPKYYLKTGTVPSGTYAGKRYWMVSDQPASGFSVHPAFMNAGAQIDQFWVGKYQGTNDGGTKLGSAVAVTPQVHIDFPTMQAFANARNTGGVTGFGLWNIYQLSAIQTLALIEMGGSDSQTLVGKGHVSSSRVVEATNSVEVAQATWRGIVGLWSNVWQMVDGLQTDASSMYKIWDKNGNKTYQTTNLTAPTSSYPVTMATATGTDYDLATVFVAETTGAGAGIGTYGGDYFYRSPGSVAYHGGDWDEGTRAGLFCLSVSNAASNSGASIGGRLAKV